MISAYPLSWPEGWKRTPAGDRKNGHFNRKERQYSTIGGASHSWVRTKDITVSDGVTRILVELEKMGVDRQDVIISTNVRTRLDGMPRSGEREPDDPGAAVYWRNRWRERSEPMRSMAVDRYATVADNLAAIAATLEAMRAIERHGGAEILERTFRGFTALPEKASTPWRDVLQVNGAADLASVEERFRELVQIHHPDKGGDPGKFQELVQAREAARKELVSR